MDRSPTAIPPVAIGEPKTGTGINGYRWIVCALLFFATTIVYIDRQILSLLKPMLDQQFGWTNEQFGAVNAAFQCAYAVGMLGFGWLVDRFGVRMAYAVSILAWSASALGHSLIFSVNGFFVGRTCLGLGEGGNFPSAIKAVALWFPKKERALATSLFNSGANIGAVVAPAIIPWIALRWGWHAAYIGVAVAGLIWLPLWIRFYDAPERQKRLKIAELDYIQSDREETQGSKSFPLLRLLKFRQAWSFIVSKALTDPVWWFFLTWLPDFFKKTRHLDIKQSWVHLVTIYSIVTILSAIGAWFTGRLIAGGWSVTRARKSSMALFALCVVPIIYVTKVGDWNAVVLIGLAGAAHQAWSANLFSTVSDLFPKKAVASLIGLGGMAGSAGAMLFPIYSGKLLDRFQSAGNITGGYTILFTLCGFAYLAAFTLNHALAPKFEPLQLD
jgi:ACS family hexuronate transporter-like MFS transporter